MNWLVRLRGLEPAPYVTAATVFLRLLGLVYLIAFVSLWLQVDGLVGSRGILPIAELLQRVREQRPDLGFWQLPTLCWLNASDRFLHCLCGAGAGLAIVAVFLPLSALLWFVLWILYLSVYTAGQDFLGFQWDILLLETGFLAIFLAPMTILPALRKRHVPARIPLLLLWWLLFRLMFASGLVKLTWGDPSWQLNDLTALTYHYETQCLPSWTAWYMHQLPTWVHQASCAAMYFIEIVAIVFLFLGRRLRRLSCLLEILLQLVIIATGNYGYFNYLTITLCVLLLDDELWPRRLRPPPELEATPPARQWPRWLLAVVGACIFLSSLLIFGAGLFPKPMRWPDSLRAVQGRLEEWTAPLQRFHIVNSYGLFRSMTKERPEIVIEGSDDGRDWKEYEFKYKPGDVTRRPIFVAPYQPRLDWQMWFEALRPRAASPWFVALCQRLLEGSPPVLELLDSKPFPRQPPRFLRAMRYDYKFTTFEERRIPGQRPGPWWKRTAKDVYLSPITMENFRQR